MSLRIEDYALIGDCQTAALVGNDGSIDWLCLPHFNSGACFAGLLGSSDNGHWQIAPRDRPTRVTRRYRGETLVLETEFHTPGGGSFALIDFMPPRHEAPDVVRIVEGRSGSVDVHMELTLRFDYGSIVPWVRRHGNGIRAIAGPDMIILDSDVPTRGENLRTVSDFKLSPGQRVSFVLTWFPSHKPQPARLDPIKEIDATEHWWRKWSGRCTYKGRWRDGVMRSLLTLKALTFAPTGGIVAAPTTSLPEHLGGVRNWDYRYCWIRDASFTLLALMHGGYSDEARAWREWLIRAVAGVPSELQIMYGLAGERRLPEMTIPWLSGYENSAPVRIGNAAWQQHQLDVYGEVINTMFHARRIGLKEHADGDWRVEKSLLDFLQTAWSKPDQGIWESRGPPEHFTHSKVMAWVAFDRAVKAIEQFKLDGPADRWRKLRDQIREEVLTNSFNPRLNAFVRSYQSDELDASVLILPLVGFIPATDPRMKGTVEAVIRELMVDGFVHRYDTRRSEDGLPPGEGAFLPCTYWLVSCLAMMGRMDEAVKLFESMLSIQNDVGLISEAYDGRGKRMLGNFPQALTHIGLISAANRISAVPENMKT